MKPGYTALEAKPETWATPVRPTGQLAGVKNMWYNLSYEPLTEGRTHTCRLSYWEHRASCEAAFFVSRRKLPDREYFVTSFRQGGYPPCTAYAAIPCGLAIRRRF